jgi:hypothetical protein
MVDVEAIEHLEQCLDDLSRGGNLHGHTAADRSARVAQ